MDNHRQTDISTLAKNSLEKITVETPEQIQCRNEIQGQVHLIEATREQKLEIYNYLHSIGADSKVLSDNSKKRNQIILNKWFQMLVIRNERFPDDIPVNFVFSHFHEMVVQNKVKIKGFNLRAQIEAFHEYMDKWEYSLRKKWWMVQNPGDRPKAIAPTAHISEEEQEIDDAQRSKTIIDMYGTADNVPEALKRFV